MENKVYLDATLLIQSEFKLRRHVRRRVCIPDPHETVQALHGPQESHVGQSSLPKQVLVSDHHTQRISHICTDDFGTAYQHHNFSNKLTKLTIQTSWSSWFRCIFQNRPKVLRTVDQYDKFENGDEPHYHKKHCIYSIHPNLSKMSN
ncbi:hypothetical protein T12_15005 [Trichinella patagoniensis]|uniref:Uncharacterized protein n=1 Tax=Trichinella patagoniensis TaxID=990121 RepID=A0A0V0ZLR9_9BILA|nr:hypothetical protein T12_15005 [Trichinella patagoniensis]